MASSCDNLRANIRAGLARLDISQSELARRAGLTPAYISQLLAGKNASPGLQQIESLASALGTTPSRLLAGPEDRPDPWDAFEEVSRLLKELRDKGIDSPEIRAMFGFPPKK